MTLIMVATTESLMIKRENEGFPFSFPLLNAIRSAMNPATFKLFILSYYSMGTKISPNLGTLMNK